jgi:hypothetical protein
LQKMCGRGAEGGTHGGLAVAADETGELGVRKAVPFLLVTFQVGEAMKLVFHTEHRMPFTSNA